MKLAINIARTGGNGGVARSLFSLVKAMEYHDIDIYTMQFISNGFVPQGKNVTIRWFEKNNNELHITIDKEKEYDLFIYYASRTPIYLGEHLKSRKRIVIPNGNDVRPIEKRFDYVYCEAEDGIRYFATLNKKALITPCIILPVDHLNPIDDLPEKYFLTVFNPYDLDRHYSDGFKPYKGYDLIYEIADFFALPLVWCHTDEYSHNIHAHPNIIHFTNLEQQKMYYLYQNATAYVSFSREESFGYAIADAMMFDKPIISRSVGVISLLDKNQKGLYLYRTKDGLKDFLKTEIFEDGDYDKTRFSPRIFEKELMDLANAN